MLGATTTPLREVLFLTEVVWIVLEIRQAAMRRPEARRADRGSRIVLPLCYAAGYVAAVVLVRVAPAAAIRPQLAADCLGLVLLWSGVTLRLWCFRTLGRYFTFTVQTSGDQPVISSGPYRIVRHPSYAGVLLAFAGVGLFFHNYASLLALVAGVAVGVAYRIRVEEHAMLRDLGAPYQAYAAGRKRIVPFVW
jgi:protein-S-isoprenylcysteine O-methyltransferase Ste14